MIGGESMTSRKEQIINEIDQVTSFIVADRNKVNEIKEQLILNGITGGRLERVFSDASVLEEEGTDIREIALILEQFFLKTGKQDLNPDNFFTKTEMNEARQYYPIAEVTQPTFPFVLERVGIAKNNVYSAMIDTKTICEWMKVEALYYNYDIQRQAKKKVRKNTIINTPTVNQKNVDEIEGLLLSGELVVTTLAFNAAPLTSDMDEELTYDAKKGTLTINSGTRLDVLDGFHRCLASANAQTKNPDLDFKFNVLISNYTTREAQQYQAQLAKATPIPKARMQELEANRHADAVVQQLKANSELRGRVSSSHTLSPTAGELVSYKVLADAIDKEFKMTARRDTFEVSKFLGEFFDFLIGDNQEEFFNNSSSKLSLKNYNKMFAGYVALAAKMKNENVSPQKLNKVLEQVDFSRENPLWRKMDLIDDNLNINSKASVAKIANYFRELEV